MSWPPRRVISNPVAVSVVPAGAQLPAWVPPAGLSQSYFNNITRSDNGLVHLASSIDPDVYAEDGSPSPYPLIMHGTSGFLGVWNAQAGGAYAPDLGDLGSILLYAGGHYLWDGSCLVRFDLATGMWSHYIYPIYSGTQYSIVGGTVATQSSP